MEIKAIKYFEKMLTHAGNSILCWPKVCPQEIPLWRWACLIIKLCLFVCNVFVAVSEVRAFAVVVNGNVKTKLINRHLTKLRKWVDWHNQRLPSCTSWWPDDRMTRWQTNLRLSRLSNCYCSLHHDHHLHLHPHHCRNHQHQLHLPHHHQDFYFLMTRWQIKSRLLLRSNQGHLITAQSKNPRKGLKIWS